MLDAFTPDSELRVALEYVKSNLSTAEQSIIVERGIHYIDKGAYGSADSAMMDVINALPERKRDHTFGDMIFEIMYSIHASAEARPYIREFLGSLA